MKLSLKFIMLLLVGLIPQINYANDEFLQQLKMASWLQSSMKCPADIMSQKVDNVVYNAVFCKNNLLDRLNKCENNDVISCYN